jgi:HTH-type transcriptional regulator, transcriptional repressor of NAD biosynthesis genes
MTALPPTTGHLQLIQFANELSDEGVTAILCTQPDEPFVQERLDALDEATAKFSHGWVNWVHIHREMPQDPHVAGFRYLWQGVLIGAGAKPGDYLVTSEPYGKWLAKMTEMVWMPYDVERDINGAKASVIRNDMWEHFGDILPEFQPHLQTRVTIFGAESTGKTTLANKLAAATDTVLFEWARPFLERTENVINVESMTRIWHGQAALQKVLRPGDAVIVQDTDLFSTLGYWQYWCTHYERRDKSPDMWCYRLPEFPLKELREQAHALKSDLYIITTDDVPFVPDPLRYGGDRREIGTDWWITFAKIENLPYLVLPKLTDTWVQESAKMIQAAVDKKAKLIDYDRGGF